MDRTFTVVICAPDLDAVVSAALVGRAAPGRTEVMVFDSERLAEFFGPSVQQKLPRVYELVLCGLEVTHRDWDGALVRPRLMDALRAQAHRVRWFSARRWSGQDLQAVAHLIGSDRLVVSPEAASVASLVRQHCCAPDDSYADALVRFAEGRLSAEEQEAWGADLRLVLTALRADPGELAAAVGLLMEERTAELIERHVASARELDEQNRRLGQSGGEPIQVGEVTLVRLSLPRPRHPFWPEISAHARAATGARISLCRLEGRPVIVIAREASFRVDLRAWVRYVTDLMPSATAVEARPDVVPLVISGLQSDPGLADEALSLMKSGAHLLRD